jgi:hypothetical protein
MTILPVQAPSTPKILLWPRAALSRMLAVTLDLFDVMVEAERQAREAEKRYPFTVW